MVLGSQCQEILLREWDLTADLPQLLSYQADHLASVVTEAISEKAKRQSATRSRGVAGTSQCRDSIAPLNRLGDLPRALPPADRESTRERSAMIGFDVGFASSLGKCLITQAFCFSGNCSGSSRKEVRPCLGFDYPLRPLLGKRTGPHHRNRAGHGFGSDYERQAEEW